MDPMADVAATITGCPPDTQDFFEAMDVIGAFTGVFEPGRYSPEDTRRLLDAYTRIERFGSTGKALAAARLAESNAHLRSGHRTPAEALSAQTGDPIGESIGLLRLGESLTSQPDLDQAMREGDLSKGRAALVADAIAANPGKEAELVEGAKHDTFTQLKQRCLRAKAEARSAEDEAAHRRAIHAKRRCRFRTDSDGAFTLDALLTPEDGASLVAALKVQADRFFDQARRAGLREPVDAYWADALLALVTRQGILPPTRRSKDAGGRAAGVVGGDRTGGAEGGAAASSGPAGPGGPDGSGGPDDSAEPCGCDHGPGPTPDPKATVAIRVDLDALRRGSLASGEICEIPGVGPVSVEWVRERLGTALLELVIANGTDVTTIYRMGRHVPPVILSALLERDPRCVVPGCDKRLGLENDHWATEFAKGGLISMENLARLCKPHHQLRTHGGFQLKGGPGQWEWIAPDTPRTPRRPPPRRRTGRTKRPAPGGTDPPLFEPEG
jgi:hypothetical protein